MALLTPFTVPNTWNAQQVAPILADTIAQGITKTMVWKAPWPDCETNRMFPGQEVVDYADLVAAKVTVEPLSEDDTEADGNATVTVEFAPAEWGFGTSDAADPNPQPLLRYDRIDKSILSHPDYRVGGGGDFELDYEDLAMLDIWASEPDYALKSAWQFTDPVTREEVTLSENAQEVAKLLIEKVDTYFSPAPVISHVHLTKQRPACTAIGFIYTAAELTSVFDIPTNSIPQYYNRSGTPTDYQWLCVGEDRQQLQRGGNWKRNLEFQGAEYYPVGLYPRTI